MGEVGNHNKIIRCSVAAGSDLIYTREKPGPASAPIFTQEPLQKASAIDSKLSKDA